MKLNLIIDGNYILTKMSFTLNKSNLLYGELYNALERKIDEYKSYYPFSEVVLVSDLKEKSWRDEILGDYKGTRKKSEDIDWEFVFNTYNEFKEKTKVKILEQPKVEGDDWISFLTKKFNNQGISTFILAYDKDFKQLINMDLENDYMNIMYNDNFKNPLVYIPKNYKMLLNKVHNMDNNDIFNLNNNNDFLQLIDKLSETCKLQEIDSIESLVTLVIQGDRNDNISSVYTYESPSGKNMGIGEAGALKIYKKYIEEFGEVKLDDPHLPENIADLVCEAKKISNSNIPSISNNVKRNFSVIELTPERIPENLLESMEYKYKECFNL